MVHLFPVHVYNVYEYHTSYNIRGQDKCVHHFKVFSNEMSQLIGGNLLVFHYIRNNKDLCGTLVVFN